MLGKRLYIRNLEMITDSAQLEAMFTCVGDVMSATASTETCNGKERRVGYVEMATEQEAVDCIDRFHGKSENGRTLVVTEDKPHIPRFDKKEVAERSAAAKSRSRK
jgi:RNA recognition motif-containing protein